MCQSPKDALESIGLTSFDLLGFAPLTQLKQMENSIRKLRADFTLDSIPLDDKATFDFFAEGNTDGVFQFESDGMEGILKRAKPRTIEELTALNALYRPGPMQLIPSFIERKMGREEIFYPHSDLDPILESTYGIIVHQEQFMEIAHRIGGFSLGKAIDVLMSMKLRSREEMPHRREDFLQRALEKGYSQKVAEEIREMLVSSNKNVFNKSHAACYTLIAYRMAYCRVCLGRG